jgi:DNA polymerase-3 subunit gamma/tau
MARLLLPSADDGSAGHGARLDRLERGWAPPAATASADVAQQSRPAVAVASRPTADDPTRPTDAGVAVGSHPTAGSGTRPTDAGAAVASRPMATVGAPPTDADVAVAARPPAAGAADASHPALVDPSTAEVEPSVPEVDEHWSQAAADTPSAASFGSTEAHSSPVDEEAVVAAAVQVPAAPRSGQDTEMLRRRWPEVLETVKGLRRVTWILVGQNAQVHDLDASVLRLSFPSAGMVDRFRDHADVVARAVRETLGFDVHVQAVVGGAPAGPDSSGTAPTTSATPAVPGPADATPHGIPTAEEADASWDAPARPSAAGAPAGEDARAPGARGGRSSAASGRASSAAGGSSAAGSAPAGGRGSTAGSASGAGRTSTAGSVSATGRTATGGSASAAGRTSTPGLASAPGRGSPAGVQSADQAPDEDDEPDEPPIDMPDDELPDDLPPDDIDAARPPAEDEPSPDDPLIEGSNLVGAPLVARLLGGTVIEEQVDEPGR